MLNNNKTGSAVEQTLSADRVHSELNIALQPSELDFRRVRSIMQLTPPFTSFEDFAPVEM